MIEIDNLDHLPTEDELRKAKLNGEILDYKISNGYITISQRLRKTI